MNKKMKAILRTGILAVIALFLIACSTDAPGSGNGDTNDANGDVDTSDITIGFSVSTLNNPYFVTLSNSVEEAAEAEGINVIVVDAQDDPSKQVSGRRSRIRSWS